MNNKHLKLMVVLILWITVLASGTPAHAVLGEPADSIGTDEKALSAVGRTSEVRNGYTVHEMRSESNTVREFVSPSGTVFAIVWDGQIPPDLTPLLGSYAEDYKAALRRTPREPGRRPYQVVKTDRVVVEQWGHMRHIQGRAYAPALMPPGVSVDEIK